jgi:hypothetical protein
MQKAITTLAVYLVFTVALIVVTVTVAGISPTSLLLTCIVLCLMIPLTFRAVQGRLDLFSPCNRKYRLRRNVCGATTRRFGYGRNHSPRL